MREFQKFYQDNLVPIYRYVYSKVGNPRVAEDVTTHIFLKAQHDIATTRRAEIDQEWLLQIAHVIVADYGQAHVPPTSTREAGETRAEDHSSIGPLLKSGSSAVVIQRILHLLPERYREVLIYRFLFNLTTREVASSMNLTENEVIALQYQALRHAAELERVATAHTATDSSN